MTATVLLVDDEALIRAGMRAIIDAEDDLTVVGEAGDGDEVVPLVRSLRPDVVLMDVRMPEVDGIEATRRLVETVESPPRVLVVMTFEIRRVRLRRSAGGGERLHAQAGASGRRRARDPAGRRGRVALVPCGHSLPGVGPRERPADQLGREGP